MDIIIFIFSLTLLIYGADIVIKESEKIALHFNISSFVIGASLVAFGTSLPEFAASISASYNNKGHIALSNVLGSVMLNIVLVLGSVFLFAKNLNPKRDMFKLDSVWILVPVGVFVLEIFNGVLSRYDGFLLLMLMVGYLIFLSNNNSLEDEVEVDLKKEKFNWLKTLLLLFVGFVLVVKGADYTIDSASNIARMLGVSEWVIGLLLLAFGTSLPELIVSVKAALKGNAEMSIGNIIGSNVANFSTVLGGASLINPIVVDLHSVMFDVVALVVVSFAFVFVLASRLYNKTTGIIFLGFLFLIVTNALKL